MECLIASHGQIPPEKDWWGDTMV